MTILSSLPPEMCGPFRVLASRIRMARRLRGFSNFIGVLVIVFIAAFLADWFFGLSNFALRLWFLAFIFGGAAATLVGVVLPLSRPLDSLALAGLIEKHYPALGERLSSAVGLTPDSTQGHGAQSCSSPLFARTPHSEPRPWISLPSLP